MNIKGLTLASSILTVGIGAASAEVLEQPYQWTCKAQGFYRMTVSPDGSAHPTADLTPTQPIHITIRPRSEKGLSAAHDADQGLRIGSFDARYVVSLEGPISPFTTDKSVEDYNDAGVNFDFPLVAHRALQRQELRSVEAIYWGGGGSSSGVRPTRLSLHRADKDWVFLLYKGNLTTDAEARHLNITATRSGWEASAEVYFLTGPCVRDS